MRSTAASPVRTTTNNHGWINALYRRFAHIFHEIGKFGIVGAFCYILDVLIYTIWAKTTGQPYAAIIISTILATSVAFFGNRFWTWRHRGRTSLRREYLLYFGFNAVGLAIGVACLWVSHNWLGSMWPSLFTTTLADIISGKVVGVGLASLFRFWAYRRFVFTATPVPSETI